MTAISLYSPHDSILDRLHPLTKLALAGFALVAAFSAPGLWGSYLVVGLLIFPLAVLGKVFGQLIRTSWLIILPFAVSIVLIQGLFWQGGAVLAQVGPLSIKTEGVLFAVASSGRILAMITSFLLFAFTTRPDDLMIALSQRGLPAEITYIVLTTIQIVPHFQARARTIIEAQQSRGLSTAGNPLQRARALLPLVIPLVLSSIVDVEQRAIALEARAFNHPHKKTSYRQLVDDRVQRIARLALLLLTIAAPILRLVLGVAT